MIRAAPVKLWALVTRRSGMIYKMHIYTSREAAAKFQNPRKHRIARIKIEEIAR